MNEVPTPVSTQADPAPSDGSKKLRTWALWLSVAALAVGAFALRGHDADSLQVAHAEAAHAAPAAAQPVPRFIDLGSDSCRSCQAMIPVIAELRRDYSEHLDVSFVDVWDDPAEGRRYGVQTIPTQILFAPDGHELERHVGYWPVSDVIARLASYGYDVPTPERSAQAQGAE